MATIVIDNNCSQAQNLLNYISTFPFAKQVDETFVNDEWLDEFFKIPAEFRCNPFEVSPSGDLYFADKRNLEQIEEAKEQVRKGQGRVISIEEIKQMCGI